ARGGAREAARLADEVFARALGRVPKERDRARATEAAGTQTGAEEARNIIARSLEYDAEELSSVLMLASGDKALQTKVDGLVDQLSGMWLLLTGVLSEQRKGKRVIFTLEAKEQPQPKEQKPRNPKEASRPRSVGMDYSRIPARKVSGPMDAYYYNYVADRASGDEMRIVQQIGGRPKGGIILYEILNL